MHVHVASNRYSAYLLALHDASVTRQRNRVHASIACLRRSARVTIHLCVVHHRRFSIAASSFPRYNSPKIPTTHEFDIVETFSDTRSLTLWRDRAQLCEPVHWCAVGAIINGRPHACQHVALKHRTFLYRTSCFKILCKIVFVKTLSNFYQLR